MKPIYLDNHATTALDPKVFEAMKPYFLEEFGNAASRNHVYGNRAFKAVEDARAQVARLINAEPKEIVFTSGATESNNLAVLGLIDACAESCKHIITSMIEHKAVLDSCRVAEKRGAQVTYLPVDSNGQISLEELKSAISDKTALISIMFANNEIGTINEIAKIGEIARERNITFHTDAVQATGRVPIDVQAMGIHLLSLSGHKIYGPKGVGALYVRSKNPRIKLNAQVFGGGHERGLRSGTLNVPGIVGLGMACQIAQEELEKCTKRQATLRNRLQDYLLREFKDLKVNGHPTMRLCNNLSISVPGVEPLALSAALCELAVSSGSACSTGSLMPSHVLRAIGLKDDLALCTVRFGLGRFTTDEEVDQASHIVVEALKKLKNANMRVTPSAPQARFSKV